MSLERRKKKNKNQNCFTKEKKKNPIIGSGHLQDKTPGHSVCIRQGDLIACSGKVRNTGE